VVLVNLRRRKASEEKGSSKIRPDGLKPKENPQPLRTTREKPGELEAFRCENCPNGVSKADSKKN